jgi:hypothetical protein
MHWLNILSLVRQFGLRPAGKSQPNREAISTKARRALHLYSIRISPGFNQGFAFGDSQLIIQVQDFDGGFTYFR